MRRVRALLGHLRQRWRASLRFRVVLGTIVGSTLVLALLMPALLGNISAGVLGSKEASALAEATAARSEAQRILDATPAQGSDVPASRTIDAVVAAMAARGAQAGLFEVLVLASEPAGLSATPGARHRAHLGDQRPGADARDHLGQPAPGLDVHDDALHGRP